MHHYFHFFFFFFFNDAASTEIYTLSLHDALPISTSSPRDTTASPLRASAERATSRAPAALFTTMASSAPVNSTRKSRQSAWREPRVPWARSYSRFEYPAAMR